MTPQPNTNCRARPIDKPEEWVCGWQVGINLIIPIKWLKDETKSYVSRDYSTPAAAGIIYEICSDCVQIDPKSLQVSTGRKDKNGNEIFGGMLCWVKIHNAPSLSGIVQYLDDELTWWIHDEEECRATYLRDVKQEDIEIIPVPKQRRQGNE